MDTIVSIVLLSEFIFFSFLSKYSYYSIQYCIWSPIPFLLYLLFHVSSVPVSYVLQYTVYGLSYYGETGVRADMVNMYCRWRCTIFDDFIQITENGIKKPHV
jgi:hypothetical protein